MQKFFFRAVKNKGQARSNEKLNVPDDVTNAVFLKDREHFAKK